MTCSHSVQCTFAPPAFHYEAGCAASTEVHCGSGSCSKQELFKKKKGGVGWGLADCMHSHLSGGTSEKPVVVC